MNVRQRQIVDYINAYWEENWTSPTVREIGTALGLTSPSSVHRHLVVMTLEGILEEKRLSGNRVLYRTLRPPKTS